MDFRQIILRGKFYYPASMRYSPGSIVICDRCDARNLISCIGVGNYDLCLPCANIVVNHMTGGSYWQSIYPNMFRNES